MIETLQQMVAVGALQDMRSADGKSSLLGCLVALCSPPAGGGAATPALDRQLPGVMSTALRTTLLVQCRRP